MGIRHFNDRDSKAGISISKGELVKEYVVHAHDFYELVIITHGTAPHYVNNQIFEMHAGDVFVFKGADFHGFGPTEKLILYNVSFLENKLSDFSDDVKNCPGYKALFVLEPQYMKNKAFNSRLHLNSQDQLWVNEMLLSLEREFKSDEPASQSMLNALFTQLIIFLSRKYAYDAEKAEGSMIYIARAVTYIEEYYTETIRLEQLAEIANLSVCHFCRIFKKIYNMPPLRYIIELRIKKACMLLQKNDNIKDVAYQCGFYDSNYFSRMFKKVKGITPYKYLKNSIA